MEYIGLHKLSDRNSADMGLLMKSSSRLALFYVAFAMFLLHSVSVNRPVQLFDVMKKYVPF